MESKVSVTELNTRVKDLLVSTPYLRDLWVVGEISNFKTYTSGHCYFTLKDSAAQVASVMFRGARSRIDFNPTDSMKVEAYGHVDLYPERGSYQFIVETMRRAGTGDLYLEYERLKKKLQAEGLFDSQRKRPIPRYPKTIGVVTSPTGAVIHDILTTTKRLYPCDILLAPAKVQGEGSAKSIVEGIELLNKVGVDVIIVGRGGGSLEDLWAFNEEPVVRAIVASKVPVISSVGHETDVTLSDFAADKRAPTPTGAAELAVRDKVEIRREIEEMFRRANNGLSVVLGKMHVDFDKVDGRLDPRRAADTVDRYIMKLDDLSHRAGSALDGRLIRMHMAFDGVRNAPEPALRAAIHTSRTRLQSLSNRPDTAVYNALSASRRNFESIAVLPDRDIRDTVEDGRRKVSTLSARLDALNPYSVLERGYSFVAGPDGRAITSVKGLECGSTVTIRMRDGKAEAGITAKEEFDNE